MSDERFIELAKEFLKYSFDDIDFEYDGLTGEEQRLLDKEEFELFVEKIREE